jgi:hypothetical protein
MCVPYHNLYCIFLSYLLSTLPGLRYLNSCSESQMDWLPCRGGVEYIHRNPASRRRRRKGKSRIWDSKIWSRVPRDSDPKMTALARARSNCKRHSPCRQRKRPTSTNPQLSDSNENLVVSPRRCFIPRRTGRLTVGRNIRLRLIHGLSSGWG